MNYVLQPQGGRSGFLFLRDDTGEELWWGEAYREAIEVARLDSISEVRRMIAREEAADLESLERSAQERYVANSRRGFYLGSLIRKCAQQVLRFFRE